MKISDFLAGLLEQRRDARKAEEDLLKAVEAAADLLDPKIRWVSGYRKKLKPAVARTLEYADELISKIPGPIIAHPDRWDQDSLLRAIFSSPDELNNTFSVLSKGDEFRGASAKAPFFALLTMTRQEKTVFGVKRDGEIIKRDVARTAVNFVDLQIVAPSVVETETRERLRRQAVTILCSQTMGRILALRSWAQELVEQREILQIKLKIHQSGRQSIAALMCGTAACDAPTAQAQSTIEELDRKITESKAELGGPPELLDSVVRILSRPEEHLWIEPLRLRLSPMGFKVATESSEPSAEIELCEFKVREGMQRAAVFVLHTPPLILITRAYATQIRPTRQSG
jgi:hypothetical protein